MQPALHARVFPSIAAHSAGEGVSDMINKDRGPEWQGDDNFGAGWGNQTTHDQHLTDSAEGENFGAGARAGALTKGGYGASPGGTGFAIRDEAWHEEVEKIRA